MALKDDIKSASKKAKEKEKKNNDKERKQGN